MNKIITATVLFSLSGMVVGFNTPAAAQAPTGSMIAEKLNFDQNQWNKEYDKRTAQGVEVINRAKQLKSQLDKLYKEKGYLDPKIAGAIYKAYDDLFKDVGTFLGSLDRDRQASSLDFDGIAKAIVAINKMTPHPSTPFFPEKCLTYQRPIIEGKIEMSPTNKLAFHVYTTDKWYFFINDEKNPGPGVIGTGKEIYISRTPSHMVEQAMLGKDANGNDVVVCLGAKPIRSTPGK